MSSYRQDPDDTKKQSPGALPNNAYDRYINVVDFSGSFIKTPNSVFINNVKGNVGFFFGNSASFAELDLDLSGTGQITCSNGSNSISGSGTSFSTELVAGDKIEIISSSARQVYS